MPTEPCNVHGEPHTRLVRDLPAAGDLPRAELAVDLRELTPVIIRTPALLADKDPYNSIKQTLKPQPEPEKEAGPEGKIDGGRTDNPLEEEPVEIRKAIPVGPLDEAPEDPLLKS